METLKESLATMSDLFHTKMNEFQSDLQKSSASSTTTSSLASDFAAFRDFIIAALKTVQMQVEFLSREVDRLEMRGRRKILLLHGLSEEKSENAPNVIASVVVNKLQIPDFTPQSITRVHRIGRMSEKKPRPLLVKFRDTGIRDKVWFAKTKLKGTGTTISEFLTKPRHCVFMEARQRFGITKCWTREGTIHVLDSTGQHHQVTTMSELHAISSSQVAATSVQPSTSIAKCSDYTTQRPKRTNKK